MNRKLIFGLASASFASLFWACGSGDIVGKDQNDVYVEYSLEDSTALSGLIYNAMVKYCTDSVTNILSEQCLEQIKKDDSNENTQSSSSITPLSPYNNSVHRPELSVLSCTGISTPKVYSPRLSASASIVRAASMSIAGITSVGTMGDTACVKL